MDLFAYVGERIKELRTGFGGKGLSQEKLAKELGISPNTISRWETATYNPTLADLDKLARFFGKSILFFFPQEKSQANEKINALLRTAKQLHPADIEELQRYAEYRRAQNIYAHGARPKPGRKRKMTE